MQQRFSLSGIPYGVGFAGTQTVPAAEEEPAEPIDAKPRTLIIDGTEDLPEIMPPLDDEPMSRLHDDDSGTPPAIPRRFNPWN